GSVSISTDPAHLNWFQTRSLTVDSSGRSILYGEGTVIYSPSQFALQHELIRLNQDGSLDNSFGYNGAFPVPMTFSDMALDSQGRINLSKTSTSGIGVSRLVVVDHPDGPFFGVATQTVTVEDVPATVAMTGTGQLPTDANNVPTAPVGTLITFGGSFSDNPL